MRKQNKYTKELLEPIVVESISVADVMRKLGFQSLDGGSHSHITKVIRKLGIDTQHFLGKAANSGDRHRGGHRRTTEEILSLSGNKTCAAILRKALLNSGIEFKCGECGLGNTWNNKPLVLEIHHKNGNNLDNNLENLQFLCPNCHSQT